MLIKCIKVSPLCWIRHTNFAGLMNRQLDRTAEYMDKILHTASFTASSASGNSAMAVQVQVHSRPVAKTVTICRPLCLKNIHPQQTTRLFQNWTATSVTQLHSSSETQINWNSTIAYRQLPQQLSGVRVSTRRSRLEVCILEDLLVARCNKDLIWLHGCGGAGLLFH